MTSTPKGSNRQLAINMASGVAVFVLNLCITFFLTPYIVEKLGTGAYGFIGLSNTIIGYTSLLTVAINALAGRFITISVHEGNIEQANRYLSSVFFANAGISLIILVGFSIMTIFLQDIINIPTELVSDVKLMFFMFVISSCIGLISGVIGVGTFIRNRLDLANIANIIGSVLRAVLILLLFGLLPSKLWYYGIAALAMTSYAFLRNYIFLRRLTPELHIRKIYFRFKDLCEVTLAGMWTIITRISSMLSQGFNLLLANLFINAHAMGVLSIVSTIPSIIIGFFGTIVGNFSPEYMRLYAQKDMNGLLSYFNQSLRINGFLSAIPISICFAYGDIFYHVWLPTEDADWLYTLTCLSLFGMSFALPQEPLWQIFTVTNKIRRSSLNLLYNSCVTFSIVFLSMFIVDGDRNRLLVLAATSSVVGAFRCLTFLPFYGAKCLDLPRFTFYPLIIRNTINLTLLTGVSLALKWLFLPDNWAGLFIGTVFTCIAGMTISYNTVLRPSDRTMLKNVFKRKLHIA